MAWKNGGVISMGKVPAALVSCSMRKTMATTRPGTFKAANMSCIRAANTRATKMPIR